MLLWPKVALPLDPIQVAGRPVEVALSAVSGPTVRIAIRAIEGGKPQAMPSDGALVQPDWEPVVARVTSIRGTRIVKCGNVRVSLSDNPLRMRFEGRGSRMAPELSFDPVTGKLSFQTGGSPLLGLGQGGPQFDRRGNIDRMGSGQAAYKLGTHGARVPIQFLIGTAGWAMYIHAPLGSFDLTANPGQFLPPDALFPWMCSSSSRTSLPG